MKKRYPLLIMIVIDVLLIMLLGCELTQQGAVSENGEDGRMERLPRRL